MATINVLKDVRIKKLEQLRKLGINPYPAKCFRKNTIKEAREMMGKEVVLVGRVMGIRGHGKILFNDLIDESGKIQLLFKSDILDKKSFSLLELIDIGDFLSIKGIVGKTQAGEITVTVSSFQIITKSVTPWPDKWHGLKDVEERYRKRYVDLMLNPQVKERIQIRGKVIQSIRELLTGKGYLEVETPTLQPIYGGGFARPFKTHHNALDADFFLRISDEMYLKRLIVGGFEKVFEITKVFRNEGIDHDHNPEFTMFEAQIAYEDYTYGMDIFEELVEFAADKVLNKTELNYQGQDINLKRPWKRYKLVEAIKEFTKIDPLNWNTIDEARKGAVNAGINPEKKANLDKLTSIGEIIAFVFEEKVEEKLIQPTIIYDYPVEVSPLAKKCEDERFTQRFEVFVFGSELGNNYSELNDPLDLRKRFIEEKKREKAGFAEAHQTDYDYLEAIEHGFPPTCGLGMGVDRLVMLLTDASSIKEVIAFPTLKPLIGDKETKQPEIKNESSEIKEKENTDSSGKKYSFNRKQALELLHKNMQNPNLRRHCYGVEAVMRALARHFKEDEELWGMVGLLHDADYELTKNDTAKHALTAAGWLKETDADPKIGKAILAHGWKFVEGCSQPVNNLEWSIYTCDELTGLIVAVTLVRPDKKLASVTVESVQKKWGIKAFAAGANREMIALCEEKLGIQLADFIKIALNAMQGVSSELGL